MLSAASSVLLYGAPVWADSVKIPYQRAEIEKVQRRAALRCVSAYRTDDNGIKLFGSPAFAIPHQLLPFPRPGFTVVVTCKSPRPQRAVSIATRRTLDHMTFLHISFEKRLSQSHQAKRPLFINKCF